MNELFRKYIAKLDKVESENQCFGCKEVFDRKLSTCSRCNQASYCSRDCQGMYYTLKSFVSLDLFQSHYYSAILISLGTIMFAVAHWPRHKAECKKLDENYSVQLARPDLSLGIATSVKKLSFDRPNGVDANERFWIKVQASEPTSPLLVYDRSRSVAFYLLHGQPGHKELVEKVKKERAFDGRKSFFRAAFDADGDLSVYPNTSTTTKKW